MRENRLQDLLKIHENSTNPTSCVRLKSKIIIRYKAQPAILTSHTSTSMCQHCFYFSGNTIIIIRPSSVSVCGPRGDNFVGALVEHATHQPGNNKNILFLMLTTEVTRVQLAPAAGKSKSNLCYEEEKHQVKLRHPSELQHFFKKKTRLH